MGKPEIQRNYLRKEVRTPTLAEALVWGIVHMLHELHVLRVLRILHVPIHCIYCVARTDLFIDHTN